VLFPSAAIIAGAAERLIADCIAANAPGATTAPAARVTTMADIDLFTRTDIESGPKRASPLMLLLT
jgi:hypothetical protein